MARITISPKLLGSISPSEGALFGVTDDGASPYASVIWSNGVVQSNVAVALCDVITAADAAVKNTLVGRQVKMSDPSGQTNFGGGICVSCYKRGADTYALVQNQMTGFFTEVLASVVQAV